MRPGDFPTSGIRCTACSCNKPRPFGIVNNNCDECDPCPRYAVRGDVRCEEHGGDPNSRRAQWRWNTARQFYGKGEIGDKAMRKSLKMQEQLSKIGDPIAIDPGEAMLEEVARSAGHVQFLRERCEELQTSELVWQQVMQVAEQQSGDGETAGSYQKMTATHAHEINKWWEMYYRERDHLIKVSAATLKAGVDERRVRLAERTSAAMGQVAENIARDLGFDPADSRVAAIIGKRFRELLTPAESATGASASVVPAQSSTPPVPTVIEGQLHEDGSVDF